MVSTIQKPQTMKMISCSKCGNDMPELRKTQYGYSFCVKCSETKNLVGAKRGIPVQMGEGDHTWTETVIMDEELYLKYTEQEEMIKKRAQNSRSRSRQKR